MTTNINDFDEFDELNSLISEQLAADAEEKRLRVLKKRIFGSNVTQTEREQHAAEIAQLELKIIWEPTAQCAVFKRMTCRCCGEVQIVFEARMLEMRHRTNPQSRRWAAFPNLGSDLPKKTMFHDTEAEGCFSCLDSVEWNILRAEVHCTARPPKVNLEDLLNQLEPSNGQE